MKSDDLMLQVIPNDFDVVRIGSCDGLTLFSAERKGLFHFVCYKAGAGVWQCHIPHYLIADAISEGADRPEEALQHPLGHDLSLLTQRRGPLGLMTGGVCFLLKGSAGAALASRMLRSEELLKAARKRVACEDGVYSVTGAKTQGGNLVSSKSRFLMEGIAFERALRRRLSAKEFGLYSAFCTHRDFPCALDKKSCLKEMLKIHFGLYKANPPSENFLQVVMAVQNSLFPYRVWQPGKALPLENAVQALATAFSKLDSVQRTQMVLLNGMHGEDMFAHLAALTGMVTFEDYVQFRANDYQPDSSEEQFIRTTTAYIQLFGELGRIAS